MNLHHPERGLSPDNKPLWQRGTIPIKPLSVWPLPDGFIEVSMWLPIAAQAFASSRFFFKTTANNLIQLLKEFDLDPELFCETYFTSEFEGTQPALRYTPTDLRESAPTANSPRRRSSVVTIDESELEY